MPIHQLEKAYNPALVEDKWYEHWLEKNYFTADPSSEKAPFTDKPNATSAPFNDSSSVLFVVATACAAFHWFK